jgi:hypothetical protein
MLQLQQGGASASLCGVGDTHAFRKTVGGWLRSSSRLLEGHGLRRIEAVGGHAGQEAWRWGLLIGNELMLEIADGTGAAV